MRWKCQPFLFLRRHWKKRPRFLHLPQKHNLLGLFPILLSDVLWLGDWFWGIFKDWYHCGSFRVCTASRLLDHRGCFQLCSAVRFLSLIFPLDIWNVLCIILQYISLRSFCMKHEMDRYPMLHDRSTEFTHHLGFIQVGTFNKYDKQWHSSVSDGYSLSAVLLHISHI